MALLPLIPARALQVGLGIMLMAHMVWHLLAHRPGPLHSPRLWGSVSGALAGFIQAVSGLGGPAIGMYAQLAHWDKDRTRGNISLYFLGLSLPLVLMQYLAGYYTGPVLQGLIPCLLGCGVGLVISYPLARKIGEASFWTVERKKDAPRRPFLLAKNGNRQVTAQVCARHRPGRPPPACLPCAVR